MKLPLIVLQALLIGVADHLDRLPRRTGLDLVA
jgi:hypothetical protein